ncbi:virulence factor MviN [Moritella sp. PE36]|uniref:lipid II flippase MurJ n=1 Tax=Moritella sp. PE36 TaxID=58051 RepID=UPI00015681BE|nr:lipid II flippase MurJ [Moritella sp. PE36]EDM69044.1 virulence factor MviN [Moritella sp. PE36]
MRNLLVSSLFVSVGLFIGRLSGFVRETFIASNFGASEQTDLIIVFLSTPDILVNLLVGGALGMALIPEFKRLDKGAAKVLYQQVMMLLLGIFCLFSICAYFFASDILNGFAPGLSNTTIQQYSSAFAVTFIAVPLTVSAGITTAFLHYNGKFLIPALGTLIFNLVLIASLYLTSLFDAEYILFVISIGVCVAALVRWGSQVINSRVMPFSFNIFNDNLVSGTLLRRYVYGVLTGGIIFLMPVVTRAIASEGGPGELSLVNYAIKLVEFPLGVVLTVFAIVFFPRFSGLFAEGNERDFLTTLKRVILSVIAISFAVFVPLQHFSSSVVTLIYDWNQLSLEQLDKISAYFYSAIRTLPFQGVNALLIAVLASRKDTLSALLCSTCLAILFFTVGYGVVSNIDELFDLMVLTYGLLSLSLFLIIIIKHRVNLCNRWFIADFIKLVAAAMIYYLLLSQLTLDHQSVWLDMLIASISCIVFLVVCVLMSKDIRQLIKFKKG